MSNSSDCAAYLRSQPGYRRCMEELRKKWESYGRAGGRIRLTDATQEERRLLGGQDWEKPIAIDVIVSTPWAEGTAKDA